MLQETFWDIMKIQVFGNEVLRWITALSIALFSTLLLIVLRRIIAKRIHSDEEDSVTHSLRAMMAGVIQKTKLPILLLISLFIGSRILILPVDAKNTLRMLAGISLLFQLGLWANYFISLLVERIQEKNKDDKNAVSGALLISLIARVAVWTAVLLVILDSAGVNVTTIVTGLGVGGIAIGLATQKVLGELFASVSIILDKPFKEGDYVFIGEDSGIVERIGMKSTRIRSLDGEMLIFSNSELLNQRIRNYQPLIERRQKVQLGVEYDTPYEKLVTIPAMLTEIVANTPQTRFVRAHFFSYGDSALIFELVYYVEVPDYQTFLDINQAINLAVFKRFSEEGLVFAFPTQTLHLIRDDKPSEAPQTA